jgi:hypothetical protein
VRATLTRQIEEVNARSITFDVELQKARAEASRANSQLLAIEGQLSSLKVSFMRAPASIDRDFALDQDVGPDEADRPAYNVCEQEPRRFRPLSAVALWLGMAVLGTVLAVVWRK